MLRGQKGITLVALVITIIVLLILAGVSISLVVGQNGVLTRATEAVEAQKEAEVKQAIALAINSCDAHWGATWATNSAYTRSESYVSNLASELGKQGYTMTEGNVVADGTTSNVWTLKHTDGTVYTVTCTLSATGTVTYTSVEF